MNEGLFEKLCLICKRDRGVHPCVGGTFKDPFNGDLVPIICDGELTDGNSLAILEYRADQIKAGKPCPRWGRP